METDFGKKYYKIKEVSEILNLPQSTLRFWEQQFEELHPKRNSHNRRFYTPEDIEMLRIISYLIKTKRHKIEYVKEELRHNRKNLSKKMQVISQLTKVRDELNGIMESLHLRGRKLGME